MSDQGPSDQSDPEDAPERPEVVPLGWEYEDKGIDPPSETRSNEG